MSNEDLLLSPHHSKCFLDWWWYEEPKGICVINRIEGSFTIPWASVRAALRRKDSPTRKFARKVK